MAKSAHRLPHLLSNSRFCNKELVRPLLENSRGRVCDSQVFLPVDPPNHRDGVTDSTPLGPPGLDSGLLAWILAPWGLLGWILVSWGLLGWILVSWGLLGWILVSWGLLGWILPTWRGFWHPGTSWVGWEAQMLCWLAFGEHEAVLDHAMGGPNALLASIWRT